MLPKWSKLTKTINYLKCFKRQYVVLFLNRPNQIKVITLGQMKLNINSDHNEWYNLSKKSSAHLKLK